MTRKGKSLSCQRTARLAVRGCTTSTLPIWKVTISVGCTRPSAGTRCIISGKETETAAKETQTVLVACRVKVAPRRWTRGDPECQREACNENRKRQRKSPAVRL